MLESFAIENFACIRSVVLDLRFAEGKAPNGYRDSPLLPFVEATSDARSRVCSALALYGPNASGKTTILMAVAKMAQVVKHGWKKSDYRPNKIVEEDASGRPTRFVMTFWKDSRRFVYEMALSEQGIVAESLEAGRDLLFRIEQGRIASLLPALPRHDDVASLFRLRCVNARTLIQTKTFLHEMADALPGLSKELLSANEFILEDILPLPDEVHFMEGIRALAATCEGSEAERQQLALRQIAEYLHRLDMPITELRLNRREPSAEMAELMDAMAVEPVFSDKWTYELQTVHQGRSGREVLLSLSEESKGTRRLIGLLGVLLAALRAGRTVLIDELDDSLHSLLVIEIVRMFKSRRINPNGAQLVFTVHNTDLLAEKMLGLSDIAIVNQRGCDGARLLRLTDVPGLRNAENFRRLYLKGHFGGIPSPHA